MLGLFRTGGLNLGLKSCCQVFGRPARAGLVVLERILHTPSFSCPCKTSASVIFTLEQVVLFGVSFGRGKSTLEWIGFRTRADVLYSCVLALERAFLRSSVPSFLFLTLERCVLRSSGNIVY